MLPLACSENTLSVYPSCKRRQLWPPCGLFWPRSDGVVLRNCFNQMGTVTFHLPTNWAKTGPFEEGLHSNAMDFLTQHLMQLHPAPTTLFHACFGPHIWRLSTTLGCSMDNFPSPPRLVGGKHFRLISWGRAVLAIAIASMAVSHPILEHAEPSEPISGHYLVAS